MITLTNEMNKFLTFLQLRFVKKVLKGLRMTRYSSGLWKRGWERRTIIRRRRLMRAPWYSFLKWLEASNTVMPLFHTKFSSMAKTDG